MTLAKRVVITGASRGIGAALADLYRDRGDSVIGTSTTGSDSLVPLDLTGTPDFTALKEALGADPVDLVLRDEFGHADHGSHPGIARRIGQCPAIVTGRYTNDTFCLVCIAQAQDSIGGTAQLEAAGILLLFTFKPDRAADMFRQCGRRAQRSVDHMIRDGFSGRKNISKCDGVFHGTSTLLVGCGA